MNFYQVIETNQISVLHLESLGEILLDTRGLWYCYHSHSNIGVSTDELYVESTFDYLIKLYNNLELKSIYEIRICI